MGQSQIELRAVQASDSAQLLAWRNAPHVSAYMYTNHEIGQAEHDAWLAATLARTDAKYWIIESYGVGVGMACVTKIDRQNSRCEWAFYIGDKEARGKRIGFNTEQWIMRYVFETLGLNKLCCEVIATNEQVIRLHQRMGFLREGLLRQHIRRGDEWLDIVQMAVLRQDWEDGIAETEMSAQFYERLDADVARGAG